MTHWLGIERPLPDTVRRVAKYVTADQFNLYLLEEKQPHQMRAIVYGSWEELANRYRRQRS